MSEMLNSGNLAMLSYHQVSRADGLGRRDAASQSTDRLRLQWLDQEAVCRRIQTGRELVHHIMVHCSVADINSAWHIGGVMAGIRLHH